MISAAGVDIDAGEVPALPTKELVDGGAETLTVDVPERFIDARQRVVQHRTASPIRAEIRYLPNVLDVVDAKSDQKGPQVALDCRH